MDLKTHYSILSTQDWPQDEVTHFVSHSGWEIWLTIDGNYISTKVDRQDSTESKYLFLNYNARCDKWPCQPEIVETFNNTILY